MKFEKNEVRAWCRKKYGNDWWKPSPEIKKQRMEEAKTSLMPQSTNARIVVQSMLRDHEIVDVKYIDFNKEPYNAFKHVVSKRLKSQNIEVDMVFHGTCFDTAQKILKHGFNRSFCGKNATVYGKGVYFAKNINYSLSPMYAVPDKEKLQYVIASRIVCGRVRVGNSTIISPNTECETFDCTVDNESNPSIFVTYNDAQVLPQFLFVLRVK